MYHISRYLVIIAAIIAFAYLLPGFYSTVASQWTPVVIVNYSPVLDSFMFTSIDRESNKTYHDAEGNVYNEKKAWELQPFIYVNALSALGTYPDTVAGQHIPAERAKRERDGDGITPLVYDYKQKRLALFPMFETVSEFSELRIPNEVFRLGDRLEFLIADTNSIDEKKSVLFTNALLAEGFSFPGKRIFGNPTTFKEYDFGYFFVDAEGVVFHVYQADSMPVVTRTGIGDESGIFHITVKENSNLDYCGILISNSGRFYQILKDGYAQKELPLAGYNPYKHFLYYKMGPLTYEFTIDGRELYVLDKQSLELIKTFSYEPVERMRGWRLILEQTIFPFSIKKDINKYDSLNIIIIPSQSITKALIFSFVLACIYFVLRMTKLKGRGGILALDIALTVVGGLYAFIALILLDIAGGLRA